MNVLDFFIGMLCMDYLFDFLSTQWTLLRDRWPWPYNGILFCSKQQVISEWKLNLQTYLAFALYSLHSRVEFWSLYERNSSKIKALKSN